MPTPTVSAQSTSSGPAHDIVVVVDGDGTVQLWNTGAECLFGVAASAAAGTHLRDLFCASAAALDEMGLDGKPRPMDFSWSGTVTLCAAGGRSATISATVQVLPGAQLRYLLNGEGVGSTGDLSGSHERLELVARHVPVGVVITDGEGRVEWVNAAYERITGYQFHELVGQRPGHILQGEATDPACAPLMRHRIRHHQPFAIEVLNYRKDGQAYWAHVAANPVFSRGGVFSRYVGIHTDITDRRRAERRIADQAALLDQAQDAIFGCDSDGRLFYWNGSCERIYGWPRQEALNGRIEQLICPSGSAEQLQKVMAAAFRSGSWRGEMQHATRTGTLLTMESRWNVLRDECGSTRGVMAVNSDMTSRRMLEARLQASERLEAVGRAASSVAHDFNNLLQPIFAGVGLLREGVDSTQLGRILNDMEYASEHAAALVRQLLLLSRGEELVRTNFDLRELVMRMQGIVCGAQPGRISFTASVDQAVGPLYGDAVQIEQVLLNLCVNARDAMPLGGRIEIEVRPRMLTVDEARQLLLPHSGDYLEISVRDSGCGIPPEIQSRIFEPFFTTKAQGHGSGIGLATVARIVRAHGGAVTVSSTVGEGSDFRCYFPVANGPTTRPRPEPAVERATGGNGETLMLVDDDDGVLRASQRMLEHFGYRVVPFTDGAAAVEYYRDNATTVALVICDSAMALMDGPAVLDELRRQNPAVRTLCASGLTLPAHRAEKHVLPKPYTVTSLLAAVRATLADV